MTEFGNSRESFVEPNYEVEARLQDKILTEGPITFADYMDICLHQPGSYYADGRTRIDRFGRPADFITSPEAHPAFGATIANSYHHLWQSMRQPNYFDIVEMGAGFGTLAKDVLSKLETTYPEMDQATRYHIVERSPALIQAQWQLLQGRPVEWTEADAAHIPFGGIRGVAASHELLDTAPVHRLVLRQRGVQEIYVTLGDNGEFVDVEGPVSTQAQPALDSYQQPVQEGVEFTVCPIIDIWQRNIAVAIDEGYLLTIDHGRLASPAQGTWQPRVYSGSSSHHTGLPVAAAYDRPGLDDITTSVDFDRLRTRGGDPRVGLRTVLHTTQAQFLAQYGFEAERNAFIQADRAAGNGIQPAVHYLSSYPILAPEYMGNFEVLLQKKVAA